MLERKEALIVSFFKAIIVLTRLVRRAKRRRSAAGVRTLRAGNRRAVFNARRLSLPLVLPPVQSNAVDTNPSESVSAERRNDLPQWADRTLFKPLVQTLTGFGSNQKQKQPLTARYEPKLVPIFEKNEHIAHRGGEYSDSATIDYPPGREIYFGSSVGLQARHGGFLSFENESQVRSSAPSALPHSRFVIMNADNVRDNAVVRYGDSVLLQAGEYELMGVKYHVKGSGNLSPYLCLINSRGDSSMQKAITFGKWILLSREDTIGTMGTIVGHLDSILLEKDWSFLGSIAPLDASLSVNGSFNNVQIDPKSECTWRIQLVSVPGIADDMALNSLNRGLLSVATNHLDKSEELRLRSTMALNTLSQGFIATRTHEYRSIQTMRSPEYKASNKAATQHKLSLCERAMHTRPRTPTVRSAPSTPSSNERCKSAAQLYEECLKPLLIPCRVWSTMDVEMSKYYDVNPFTKAIAAVTIQKFVRRYVRRFSYKRELEERRKTLDRKLEPSAQLVVKEMLLSMAAENEEDIRQTALRKQGTGRRSISVSSTCYLSPVRRSASTTNTHFPNSPMVCPLPTQEKDIHWSKRSAVNIFAKPLSYNSVSVPAIDHDKKNTKLGLKYLKSLHDKSKLYDSIELIKLGRKKPS